MRGCLLDSGASEAILPLLAGNDACGSVLLLVTERIRGIRDARQEAGLSLLLVESDNAGFC